MNSRTRTLGTALTCVFAAAGMGFADNTTPLTARSITANATFQDSLADVSRQEIWYQAQLFAGRSYQVSVWSVKEDGAFVNVGAVELYTNPVMPVLVTAGITTTNSVLEGSPNNATLGPKTTVFQPTATGLYLIKATAGMGMGLTKVNVQVRETTLFSPWTSKAAGFEGFMEIHNNTSAAVSVTLSAYNSLGVLQGTGLTFSVPANATVFQTATGIGVPVGTFAGIVLTHDGAFGAISGNITTLNGATGLSFDSPFTPRDFGGGDGGGEAGAAAGANSDITSLSGLTTPLSIPQGGTGASTAASGRMALGAAAAGANADITSLSGLSTPLSLAQGGTGASAQSFVDLSTNQSVAGIKTFSGANTFTTTQTVQTGNAAAKGVIVKGAASQTANLLEVQNSASAVLSSIGPSGIFNGNISGSAANATTVGGLTCTNGQVVKWSGSVWTCGTDVGGSGTVTGVTASAPLSSSGGIVPDLSLTGTVAVANGGTGAATAGAARTSLAVPGLAGNNSYSGTQTLVPATNALQPLVVQGLASQSANLQEWKNSAAATLASVGPTGLVSAAGFATAGSISAGSLTGLSTPLSIAQGGTGSATKPFVDLTTAQTVAGVKTFSSPIVGSVTGSAASVTGIVPIASGGTGSATQNFVDLTTAQTVDGNKTFGADLEASGSITVGKDLNLQGVLNVAGNPFLHSGTQSTFVGGFAGILNTGSDNSGVGYNALNFNSFGSSNSAFGNFSLYQNTVGNSNSAFGMYSLFSHFTGTKNSALGFGALINVSAGDMNTAVGALAGSALTSGSYNIYIGHPGLPSESNAIRIGTPGTHTATYLAGNTMVEGTLGWSGTASGTAANATTANNAVNLGGVAASQFVQTGDARLSDARNPLPGSSAYIRNSGVAQTANFNISGTGTLGGTLTAAYVNASNYYSLNGTPFASISANNSSFYGNAAGASNPGGTENTYIGYAAQSLGIGGSGNSFLGSRSGLNNSGSNNFFGGHYSGWQNLAGGNNTFVGVFSGKTNLGGSSNTVVGYNADLGAGNLTNATAIGANARVTQSNSVVIGAVGGVNGGTVVRVGIGTTAPATTLDIVSGPGEGGIRLSGGTGITIKQSGALIVTSPNGKCWGLTVSDTGVFFLVAYSTC